MGEVVLEVVDVLADEGLGRDLGDLAAFARQADVLGAGGAGVEHEPGLVC